MKISRDQLKQIILEEYTKLQERKITIKSPKDKDMEEQSGWATDAEVKANIGQIAADPSRPRPAALGTGASTPAAGPPTSANAAPAIKPPPTPAPTAPTPTPAPIKPIKPITPAKAPAKGAPIKPIKEQGPGQQRQRPTGQQRQQRQPASRPQRPTTRPSPSPTTRPTPSPSPRSTGGRASGGGRDSGGLTFSLGDVFRGIGSAVGSRQASPEAPAAAAAPAAAPAGAKAPTAGGAKAPTAGGAKAPAGAWGAKTPAAGGAKTPAGAWGAKAPAAGGEETPGSSAGGAGQQPGPEGIRQRSQAGFADMDQATAAGAEEAPATAGEEAPAAGGAEAPAAADTEPRGLWTGGRRGAGLAIPADQVTPAIAATAERERFISGEIARGSLGFGSQSGGMNRPQGLEVIGSLPPDSDPVDPNSYRGMSNPATGEEYTEEQAQALGLLAAAQSRAAGSAAQRYDSRSDTEAEEERPERPIFENKGVSHACANHVAMKESGEKGTPINHTLLEDGSVTHYVVEFKDRIVEGIPAEELTVLEMNEHMHTGNRDDNEHDEEKPRVKYETKEQNLFNRLSEAFTRR